MNWKELSELIQEMPPDRQLDDVTIIVDGEVMPALDQLFVTSDSDEDVGGVLDSGHRYLRAN